MFKQTILYYYYPPFEPYIDNKGITILNRYLYCQPFKSSSKEYGIMFVVEEKCEAEVEITQFFRTLFTRTFKTDELPENMHLSIMALADNEVFGATAQAFVQGLFTDLCVTVPQSKWMERYFPKWKREENTKKQKVMEELLKMQRRIRNGELDER